MEKNKNITTIRLKEVIRKKLMKRKKKKLSTRKDRTIKLLNKKPSQSKKKHIPPQAHHKPKVTLPI